MRSPTCPVCRGARVVVVLKDDRRGFCCDCGSRWLETLAGERMIESVPNGYSVPASAQVESDRLQLGQPVHGGHPLPNSKARR
jgi:hypothetical protein